MKMNDVPRVQVSSASALLSSAGPSLPMGFGMLGGLVPVSLPFQFPNLLNLPSSVVSTATSGVSTNPSSSGFTLPQSESLLTRKYIYYCIIIIISKFLVRSILHASLDLIEFSLFAFLKFPSMFITTIYRPIYININLKGEELHVCLFVYLFILIIGLFFFFFWEN